MEPDTDAAFIAEAEIDATRMAGRATGSSQVGEENTLASRGGIGSHVATESIPDDTLFYPTPNNDPSDDRGSGHEMAGANDFDGLPWYKRPSVRHTLPIEQASIVADKTCEDIMDAWTILLHDPSIRRHHYSET